MKYWLMKSEPEVFSIDDLKKHKESFWDGVRNYQARNYMMKDMQVGDLVLFYHSNAEPSGIAGIAKVSKKASPDPTQFDKKSEYFDEKSSKENPRWYAVHVSFVEKFKHFISLEEIRGEKAVKDMVLLQKGSRLSVQPVTEKQFEILCHIGQKS